MNFRMAVMAVGMIVLAGLACDFQRSAPAANLPTLTPPGPSPAVSVIHVTMYRDNGSGQPGDEVLAFAPADHVMHFEVRTQGLKTGQRVKLAFVAVDTANGKQTPVAEAEAGELLVANEITGQVSLAEDWPVGAYKMNIFVDDALIYGWDYRVEQ